MSVKPNNHMLIFVRTAAALFNSRSLFSLLRILRYSRYHIAHALLLCTYAHLIGLASPHLLRVEHSSTPRLIFSGILYPRRYAQRKSSPLILCWSNSKHTLCSNIVHIIHDNICSLPTRLQSFQVVHRASPANHLFTSADASTGLSYGACHPRLTNALETRLTQESSPSVPRPRSSRTSARPHCASAPPACRRPATP